MKRIILSVVVALMTTGVRAQLFVNYDYQVGIYPDTTYFKSSLQVGKRGTHTREEVSIGMEGSPVIRDKSNIGVEGSINGNSTFSLDSNYGVLGIVDRIGNTNGRNYGICGMVKNPGTADYYGGAGIYATCFTYFFAYPTNIQGAYAAYFSGSTHVSGHLTANSLYTPMDGRLCNNILPLNEKREGAGSTLENMLTMNVVQYRLKGTLPETITPKRKEATEKEREYLKKEEMEMTSRQHFAVDAQELQKIYPDLVLKSKDNGLSVNYLEMVPLLVRSIQELKAEMDMVKETADF